MALQNFTANRQRPVARPSLKGRLALAMLIASLLLGCGSTADDELSAEDATTCHELGGGLVYIRYETADATTEVRIQPGLDHELAQSSPGLSEEALEVLELRGWDEEALEELHGEEPLSPETEASLEAMPSCLEALRERGDADSEPSIGS